MKRAARVITVFIVSFSVIVCSSFSVFAYHPVVGITSADWVISSEDTFKNVYPNATHGYVEEDSPALKHEYLNGETYFASRHWNDEGYHRVTRHEFSPPLLSGYWVSNGVDFSSYTPNHIIFEVGSTFYMAIFYGFNSVYVTDESYHNQRDLQFDVSGKHGEIDFYKISYPFTSWQFVKYTDYYGGDDVVSFANGSTISDVILWYSDVNIYNYKGDKIVKSADKVNYTNLVLPVDYATPVSVLEGSVTFTIDDLMLNKLEFGSFALIVENLGFICAMETGILSFCFTATFIQNGKELGTADLISYSYDTLSDDWEIEFGKDYMYNEISIIDIDGEFPEGVDLVIDFSFVTDSYNLFFPGNMSFVEFESYEDDMEHDEVMNAINDAANIIKNSVDSSTGSINSTINSATSELALEIASTYDKLVTSTQPKPDLSIDTGEVDNIVAEEEEILNNITSDLNARTDEYLKVIGFSSIEGLFDEKINDLNNAELSASFDFVKSLFDQVVSATGVSTLLFFSLCFGFCIYVLGRRLS